MNGRAVALGFLALWFGGGPAPLAGQESDVTAELDAYVRAYHELGDFSGCVVVTRSGQSLLRECYGLADYELGVPNGLDTRFRIGSVSKQFTAAAILVLTERGVLNVSDPLSMHVPEFPGGDSITIYQLLTHTSGLRNSFGLDNYELLKRRGAGLQELVEAIAATPLDFEPGSQYAYSNSGYIVLAYLIERLSGQSYAEFLQSAIFDPAGMTESGVDDAAEIIPRRASGYAPAGLQGVENAPYVDPSVEIGAGNLHSSPGDMEHWHEALYSGRILTDSTLAEMTSRQEGFYGFGVAVYEEHDRTIHAHDGRVSGFSSDLSRYPDEDVSVIVLSNIESGIGDSFREDLGAIVFGRAYTLPAPREPPAEPPTVSELAEYAGEYEFGPGFVVTAKIHRGRLYVAANAGEFSELAPLRDDQFLSRMTYATVRFERDPAGAVQTMIWMQDDNEFPGKRVGPAAAPARSQGVAKETPTASIAQGAWLAGCWQMDDGRREMDEQWMAPSGGVMIGMNRALRDGEFRGYELLILRPRGEHLIYEAHPSGQKPAEFASTHLSDTLLVFENPSHDFPQKLVYDRISEDSILVGVFAAVADVESAFDVPLARTGCGGDRARTPGKTEHQGAADH